MNFNGNTTEPLYNYHTALPANMGWDFSPQSSLTQGSVTNTAALVKVMQRILKMNVVSI